MLRQRTESFKAHFESVPSWTGPLASKTAVWVLAAGLIAGGLLYGIRTTTTTTLEPLLGGRVLRDIELAQIELAFSEQGLTDYRRRDGRILIPRPQRHEYLAALSRCAALPYALRVESDRDRQGVGLFESEAERRRRRDDDKARNLGRKIITTFDNIAWASVDYDTRSVGGFDPTVIQSASVVLVPADGQPIAPTEIRAIRDFVCGAYAGMESDQVTVIDASSRKTFRGDEDPLQQRRRELEYELEQRLTELLSGYEGLRIAATSEVVPHAGGRDPAEASAKPQPAKVLSVAGVGLAMRVSVGVPESQFHRQWVRDQHARQPGVTRVQRPSAEQIETIKEGVFQNIRDAVTPFIAGRSEPAEQAIRLWSFPDADRTFAYADQAAPATSIKLLVATARQHVWLVAPLAALLLIALIFAGSAAMMRLQSTTTERDPAEPVTAPLPPRSPHPASSAVASPDESKLKDELADMVEQNPELAAQIVHSWMVDAA